MSIERSKVITIGGTGLVGSVLIPHLKQYFEVEDHSIDSPDPKNQLDLVDTDSFEAVIANNHRDILAVINLAAATDTNRAFSDPEYQQLCRQVNHHAPRDASRICQATHVPFLHVSTDFVYDGKKSPPNTYSETDIPLPIEFYGAMKTNGEVAVLRHDGTVLTLAFPFTQNPVRSDLVSKFTSKLSRGEFVNAFFDQRITPTYIPDFAELTNLLLKKLIRQPNVLNGHKFHCVGSSIETPASVAIQIADYFGYESDLITTSSVQDYNRLAREKGSRPYQENLALSNLKVRQATSFTPLTFGLALEEYPIDY